MRSTCRFAVFLSHGDDCTSSRAAACRLAAGSAPRRGLAGRAVCRSTTVAAAVKLAVWIGMLPHRAITRRSASPIRQPNLGLPPQQPGPDREAKALNRNAPAMRPVDSKPNRLGQRAPVAAVTAPRRAYWRAVCAKGSGPMPRRPSRRVHQPCGAGKGHRSRPDWTTQGTCPRQGVGQLGAVAGRDRSCCERSFVAVLGGVVGPVATHRPWLRARPHP